MQIFFHIAKFFVHFQVFCKKLIELKCTNSKPQIDSSQVQWNLKTIFLWIGANCCQIEVIIFPSNSDRKIEKFEEILPFSSLPLRCFLSLSLHFFCLNLQSARCVFVKEMCTFGCNIIKMKLTLSRSARERAII